MKYLLIATFTLLTLFIFAQTNNTPYFQGYTEATAGKHFGYHAPLPDVNTSLLLRGRADFKPIEWKTESVPDDYNQTEVTFIWAFGMDVTPDPVTFHLFVNDKKQVTFHSSKTSETGVLHFAGANGATLQLNVTMLDRYDDQMGFAILTLPVKAIQRGEFNKIRVEAEPDENNAWFMTFKTQVREQVNIYQNHVVVKDAGKLYHSISVDVIHVGEETTASIRIGDVQKNATLKAGYNKIDIPLPKVDEPTEFIAGIRKGNTTPQNIKFTLAPVREWEIFLVQHTHSDIGYTRPQPEILPEHLRYIDYALDYCDQTDDYPDAAKFRWTCETSWSVREYLRSRPQQQVDRLLKRLQEGRIEATGMFFNFSEIIDESALAAQTKVLRMLKKQGIDVTTAMQNDVNGIAWCLVDYFQPTDVKYLTMGIHAHRARKPFHKPTAFWWQSPAGNRLLAYRSEHYQHGNRLSLTTGLQDVFRDNLSDYLRNLESKGYPYDKISLQFSGYVTDNSPPSTKACDIIRDWNEKYEWPRLRSALARDFMVYLDEYHGDEIEAKEVAWPDWWTDGVGSAANETGAVRATQVEIAANTALLSMAKLLGADLPEAIQTDVEAVYDNLLFYDEHTHGAAESIRDPLAQNTINQWSMKAAYAWEAVKRSSALQEKAFGFLEPFFPESDQATIAVVNTLGWERSGLVRLFIDNETIPQGVDFRITDHRGRGVPVQVSDRRMEGAYYTLWVENTPPMGYRTLKIDVGTPPLSATPQTFKSLENDFYRVVVDGSRGIVRQIYDKQLQKNLVDPDDTLSLGQFIYEELGNRHELERLTSTNRDTVYRPLDLRRSVPGNIELQKTENGPIYKSVFLHGDMPVCADERGVDIEIRLYHYQKKIELHYRMFKLPVVSPEAVYVVFPFQLEKGQLAFEAQGGVVYPGINQLEGSSADWNTIQNYAVVKNDAAQIVFSSHEIPLVQFGDLNIGRYYYRLRPKTNHLFSWVLNNYWVTNFKASQHGEMRWSYGITSSDDTSTEFATRFGWGHRTPLLSRVLLPEKGQTETKLVSRSLIDLGQPNLLLVNAQPAMDGDGVILHLREVAGDHAILDVRRLQEQTGATSVEKVNVLEERLGLLTKPLMVEHYETVFVLLNFDSTLKSH